MKSSNYAAVVSLFFGSLFLSVPLSASQLWSVVAGNSGSVDLYPVDQSTGGVGAVSKSGDGLIRTAVRDLAAEPISQGGLVWAVRFGGGGNELLSVNPAKHQLVSMVNINLVNTVETLAIDPIDGGFYATTASALYRLNPNTGVATLVGNTTVQVEKGLGFDVQGNLYGVGNGNNLVAIDKSNGATSVIDTLALSRMEDIAVRPEDGAMYGIGYGPDYNLYKIDLADGSLTTVGPSLGRPSGLAFAAVPEPNSIAMSAILAVTLAATSSFSTARGRKQS